MRLIFGSRLRHKDSFSGQLLRNQGPGKAQHGTGNLELEETRDYVIGGEWGVTCHSGTISLDLVSLHPSGCCPYLHGQTWALECPYSSLWDGGRQEALGKQLSWKQEK